MTSISFIGQSVQQGNRLNEMRQMMDVLQRQITTQKKHQEYSGYGTRALNLQSYQSSITMSRGYLENIDTASSRMTMMSSALTEMSKLGNTLVTALGTGDITDMASINQMARQNLQFLEDLLNLEADGHYLFAGSDVTSLPFVDHSSLNSNFSTQVNAWLANPAANADTTMISAISSFSATQLGLSAGLPVAGSSTMRIDKSVDLDLTIKADEQGFQDMLSALSALANLKMPDPAAGDVATLAQFQSILSHVSDKLGAGIQGVNSINQLLAGRFNLLKNVKESHEQDIALFQQQMDSIENIDPSAAIISMQALNTQLTSAYQITKMVSELSLVNFM